MVERARAGENNCRMLGFVAAATRSGSERTLACPIRLSVRLIFSSAPGGRRCCRNSIDSGIRNQTSGMNAQVTKPPNTNTDRQSKDTSSSDAIVPPTTAPAG